MKRPRSFLPAILVIAVALLALSSAEAEDVIIKRDGGKFIGKIVDETTLYIEIETNAGRYKVKRRDILKVERAGDKQGEFKKRWKSVDKYDPDALYKLGKWCEDNELIAERDRCFEAALKVDSYHRKTREAMGQRRYRGKWVSEEDYNRLARGLVRWQDKWVTPEERNMYEQGYKKDDRGFWYRDGYEKDEAGGWMRPEDIQRKREWEREEREAREREREERQARKEREREERERQRAERNKPKPKPKPEKKEDKKDDGKGKRVRPPEDTAWYEDNTSTGPFASAGETESRYYKIKTNIKKDYAKRYGKMMDQYYVRFAKVFAEFIGKRQIPKSEIYIYSSQQEFMSATGMSQFTGGFYNTGTRRVTAYHGKFGGSGNTRTVLAHEGTHQFEHLALPGGFGRAPIWIIEGLAVFFESAYYNGKKVEIALVPRDRLANLKRGAANGTLIPFHDLIRTAQPQFSGYHYAHAWGLIYYMLYGSKDKKVQKKQLKKFSDLLSLSQKRRVTPEDTENVFGGKAKFEEFEEKWKKWIVELPYDFDPKAD